MKSESGFSFAIASQPLDQTKSSSKGSFLGFLKRLAERICKKKGFNIKDV